MKKQNGFVIVNKETDQLMGWENDYCDFVEKDGIEGATIYDSREHAELDLNREHSVSVGFLEFRKCFITETHEIRPIAITYEFVAPANSLDWTEAV